MWQKCPVCRGIGIDETVRISNTIPECPVCNGRRIIDTLTGQPPAELLDDNG